jgi:4-hydroxy-2-oxoheptanedioate aldolase
MTGPNRPVEAWGATPHFCTFVQIPDLNVVEILTRTKLDSFILDCQHGMFSGSSLGPALAAAAYGGKPAYVRIPVGDFAFASRALDLGAAGIVCPMVNTAADAQAFVDHVKYPPIGLRSWGPRRALPLAGLSASDYLHQANDLTVAFAMIETQQALDNLEAILATPGIDGAFLGPMDLSVSLSNGALLDIGSARVQQGIDLIADACKRHGKAAGVFALDAVQTAGYVKRGYRFIALAQDAMFMTQAADQACTKARALIAGDVA